MASVTEYLRELQSFLKKADKNKGRDDGKEPKEPVRQSLADFLSPCYFLHGDEPFFGRRFVDSLKGLLFESGSPEFSLDRFWMDESGWAEVIDAARTAPTFFSPWRLTLAEFPIRGEDRFKDREEDKLTDVEAEILDEYLQERRSLPGAVFVVLYPSRFRHYRSSPVYKMFEKHSRRPKRSDEMPPSKEEQRENVVELGMAALKPKALQGWLNDELEGRGLVLAPEAGARLIEVVGSDLQRLMIEIDKLQSYAADKVAARQAVDVEDIDRVCAWTREVEAWSLTDALSTADWPRCVEVLDKLFKEGEAELKVLNDIAGFFRDVRLARSWLEDKSMDRKAVFSKLKPQIKESYGSLYAQKFREFFLPVDRLSRPQLRRLFLELNRLDNAFKSSAGAQREMIESFVFEYCRGARDDKLRRTRG
ncbi:MAG: hypothetical protein A2Y86_03920 [Candidatus Aminicenantes bacterium RBG_13_62_12]|nr:MAG: hypothetical protein A2Y86_03920 [Candidatus Aminicenantes bacterium RBG_13_62_12]